MRLKEVPKKLFTTDGQIYATLVYEGFEPFEYKGRTLQVRRCYYIGDLYGDGRQEQFTTTESDTLWLCFVYDAFIRSGGKMKEMGKYAISSYKRFKFNHKRP